MYRRTEGDPIVEEALAHADDELEGLRSQIAARRPERVHDIDVERGAYGGQRKILAAIEASFVIARILAHLGLAARAPPLAPARGRSFDPAA